jgi:hypothetical protein
MKCQTVVFEVQDEGVVNNGLSQSFFDSLAEG